MPLQKELVARVLITVALFIVGCGLDQESSVPGDIRIQGPAAVFFSLDGSMSEFPTPSGIFSATQISQYRLEQLLKKATDDAQVKEVVVHFGTVQISFARAGELASALKQVTARGKQLTCHIDAANNLTYWMAATACPRILVSPAGGVEALGLSLEAVYIRDLLASLGITADVLNIGKYKDAAEPLTRNGMSPESREAATALLFELHHLFIEGIAVNRKLDPTNVQQLIDSGPHDATQAVKLGLADEVLTLDAYLDTLQDKYMAGVIDSYGKKEPKPFSIFDLIGMLSDKKEKDQQSKHPRIAIVPVIGPISSGPAEGPFPGMEMVQDMVLNKTLREIARDDSVKAVVLRIDSPGGSALASDNIWNAVMALKAKKPVIASLGDVAASGGYYVASAATEAFASPSTITGSIGVVGGKIVLSKAAEKLGINTERISTGNRASLQSPFSPFSKDERQVLSKLMQSAYDLFVDRIAEGRNLERSKVREIAEGRVWTGSQAVKLGLIDTLGNLADSLERARVLAALPVGTKVEILPKPKNFFELLSETFSDPQTLLTKATAKRHPSI
ncbi:MAG: signal peptide peptidase SppA, partial [Proteobacteria bacterium]|nr:signal peptide peptidase SppA [Pseudomonadota bacterium]